MEIEQILKAVHGSYGIVGTVAKRLAIPRQKVHELCAQYPEITQALKHEEDSKKDFIEQAFLDLVAGGEPRAVIFAVRCLLKDRGYHEQLSTPQQSLPLDRDELLKQIRRQVYGLE